MLDNNPYPWFASDRSSIRRLINLVSKPLKQGQLIQMVSGFDVIIISFNITTNRAKESAKNVNLFFRLHIGLDDFDMPTLESWEIRAC